MHPRALLAENEAAVQRFLTSNYFALENLMGDAASSSLTWERMHAGYAPVGMLAFVNNAMTSATRRSTMASCDSVIASLDDALRALAADTSPAYEKLEREIAGEGMVVAAEVLETLQPRTKERADEFVGLKHVTYRSGVNLGNGLNGEDYVLMETTGRDVDPDGFPFAFKVLRSVEVPGIFSHVDLDPTSRHSPRASHEMDGFTRRGHIHTFALILSETKFTGLLRMQIWLDVDLPSSGNGVPVPMDSSFASIHDALSLGLRYRRVIERHFSNSIKRDLSSAMATYAGVNLIPMMRMRVSHCQVCERKLSFFKRRRYSCEVCKASLCGTCAKTTDMCSWRLCACCYGRNHSLFSRQIMSKLTSSPFSRISFFARRSTIYRNSIVSILPNRSRERKSFGASMVGIVKQHSSISDKDSRRTSSSESSSSTTGSGISNPAASNPNTFQPTASIGQQPSIGELDQITELEDDRDYYKPVVPGSSYTDPLPLSSAVLLDEVFIHHRASGSVSSWQPQMPEEDSEEFMEEFIIEEREPARGSISFRVL